jgi:hypothetical protein
MVGPRNGSNKPKPLPWVATSCRLERMAQVDILRAKEVLRKPVAATWCSEPSSLKRFAGTRRRAGLGERLNIVPDEIDGGHCVALSRPEEVAERLDLYCAQQVAA